MKVEFEYDYRNRRVARRVYTWDGAEWDLTASRKYVWDGWRLLLELDAGGETLMVLRAYTWGLDLAGQAGGPGGAGILPAKPTAAGLLEGAGTIGGLLAVYDTYGTSGTGDDVRYVYLYDGHGNVGQLIDPVPGTYATSLFKARYEHDPYGTVVQKSGAYALGNRNPFQFSTKQFDAETGMGYWGERYYLPDVGRWANRDPIEEAGGVNLYAYVMNEPVRIVDEVGELYFVGAAFFPPRFGFGGIGLHPTAPSPRPPTAASSGCAEDLRAAWSTPRIQNLLGAIAAAGCTPPSMPPACETAGYCASGQGYCAYFENDGSVHICDRPSCGSVIDLVAHELARAVGLPALPPRRGQPCTTVSLLLLRRGVAAGVLPDVLGRSVWHRRPGKPVLWAPMSSDV